MTFTESDIGTTLKLPVKLVVPRANAGKEEWREFYTALNKACELPVLLFGQVIWCHGDLEPDGKKTIWIGVDVKPSSVLEEGRFTIESVDARCVVRLGTKK